MGDGALLIPFTALLVFGVRMARGVSCGHDFEFHLVSWFETQRSWSQGVLYPHWAQTPNWAAGEPRFVFYPPLTWMLGAVLGYTLPWTVVPAVLTFLMLTASGLAVRALVLGLTHGPIDDSLPDTQSGTTATLAGVIATATPYALFNAFERTAYGELAAAAWIPLLLLFAWRTSLPATVEVDGRARSVVAVSGRWSVFSALFPALDGSAVLLALVLAATWLTNAPAGVMASYLLAFAALSAALIRRRWWPIVRAAVAAPIGLGLAVFYLVPAAWEQRWIDIRQAVDVGMRIQDSWLFARHASPDLALHDEVLRTASILVVLTAGLAAAGFAWARVRKKLPVQSRPFWLPLILLVPILFLMQFSFSAAVWMRLPKLQFLQFPWRWLMVLGIPYSIFLASATPLKSRRLRIWSGVGWAAFLLVCIVAAAHFFFQYCDDEDNVNNQQAVFRAGMGVEGTDEYAPAASDNSLIASGLPDGCLVSDPAQELGEGEPDSTPVWYPEQGSCDATYTAQLWQQEHKLLQMDSDHAGYVILRLCRYPAWQITVNGQTVPPPSGAILREDGLIAVPVAAGSSTIEVRWIDTPDVWWGRWISLGALVAMLALWGVEWGMGRRLQSGALFRLS